MYIEINSRVQRTQNRLPVARSTNRYRNRRFACIFQLKTHYINMEVECSLIFVKFCLIICGCRRAITETRRRGATYVRHEIISALVNFISIIVLCCKHCWKRHAIYYVNNRFEAFFLSYYANPCIKSRYNPRVWVFSFCLS